MTKIINTEDLVLYREYLVSDEKSPATIEKYCRDVQRFSDFANGREISKLLMMEYKCSLGERYAVTSANSILASVSSFLTFKGWEECRVKPFRIQKKSYTPESMELTVEEYRMLIEAALCMKNERAAMLLQTICGTGIRVSELAFITVESLDKGEVVVSCKGKTRVIFLVSRLQQKLRQYAEKQNIQTGPIFITKSGKPMDRSNIWRSMKKLCEEAGIPKEKVFPHNLRHLFARTFYDIEKDIAKLADILGHASINTTRIYIMTTGAEHREKMEKMRLVM